MTDDQKKISSDDEYQFPQEEYLSSENETHKEGESTAADVESGATAAVKATRGSRWAQLVKSFPVLQPVLQNKRIVIAIVVVIAFIITLPFLNTKEKPLSAVKATPVVEQPAVVQSGDSDLGSLQPHKSHNTHIEVQVQNLKAQVANLQSAVDQAKAVNDQLSASVSALTGQVKDLMTQLSEALARMGPTAQKPGVVYHLRAVLPDRAWIISSTGETLSVTIGDEINHYGVVRSIDPTGGSIETSSGRKITYGSNDF